MPSAHLDSGRRIDRWDYPEGVIREAVVNALVHRDYSIAGTDIMLAIYADRLERLRERAAGSRSHGRNDRHAAVTRRPTQRRA